MYKKIIPLFIKLFKLTITVFLVVLLVILVSNLVIIFSTRKSLFEETDDLPARKTAIVLGTSPYLVSGERNPWFNNRMDAAAELYHSGKIQYIILSGDNRTRYYNEPEQMRREMVSRGVPDSIMYLDYAGLRTLDSMVRSKEIFGQDTIIIISQKFHNQRAIFLARAHGINAIGFNANDPENHQINKVLTREVFARVKAVYDLFTRKQPRFLGDEIKIGEDQ